MEDPQQQAISATAATIAQHLEAIHAAKQATQDIIARQKAEAKENSQKARQVLQEQLTVLQEKETHVEEGELADTNASENDGHTDRETEHHQITPQNAANPEATRLAPSAQSIEISMPPLLKNAIALLHSDAWKTHLEMQAQVLETLQHPLEIEPITKQSNLEHSNLGKSSINTSNISTSNIEASDANPSPPSQEPT